MARFTYPPIATMVLRDCAYRSAPQNKAEAEARFSSCRIVSRHRTAEPMLE